VIDEMKPRKKKSSLPKLFLILLSNLAFVIVLSLSPHVPQATKPWFPQLVVWAWLAWAFFTFPKAIKIMKDLVKNAE